MNNCDELRKELEEAEKRIADIRARLDAVKDDEWPKVGDMWFICGESGSTRGHSWSGTDFGLSRKKANNCYRTREEAEAKSKWLANPRTEARFRLEQLDGFDACGQWVIHYHMGRLYTSELYDRTGGIRFTTRAQAEYAKTHHASDLMLVLTGEVADEKSC